MSAAVLRFPTERAQRTPDCKRTLALWMPGATVEGIKCTYQWTGSIPNTGVLRCSLCGEEARS